MVKQNPRKTIGVVLSISADCRKLEGQMKAKTSRALMGRYLQKDIARTVEVRASCVRFGVGVSGLRLIFRLAGALAGPI